MTKPESRESAFWAAWKRCFFVACLVLSASIRSQAFSAESVRLGSSRVGKIASLQSTSADEETETTTSIDSADTENSKVDMLVERNTDLLSSSSSSSNSNEYFGRNGYSMTSGYGRFLYTQEEKPSWPAKMRRKKKKIMKDMNEDGYADLRRKGHNRSFFQKVLRLPVSTAKLPFKVFSKKTREPGTLILVRHGESEWNKNKTFTGWADPDLTDQGKREVEHAARLLMEGGYHYDIHVVFTSRLKRYAEKLFQPTIAFLTITFFSLYSLVATYLHLSNPIQSIRTFVHIVRFVPPGSCSKNLTRCICLSSRAGASMVRNSKAWRIVFFLFVCFDLVPFFHLTRCLYCIALISAHRTILWCPHRIEQDRNCRTTRRRSCSGMESFPSQSPTSSDRTGSVLSRTRSQICGFDQRRNPCHRIPFGLHGKNQTPLGQQNSVRTEKGKKCSSRRTRQHPSRVGKDH